MLIILKKCKHFYCIYLICYLTYLIILIDMSSLTIVKPPPVINRSAAPIQITAAQLLADARIH